MKPIVNRALCEYRMIKAQEGLKIANKWAGKKDSDERSAKVMQAVACFRESNEAHAELGISHPNPCPAWSEDICEMAEAVHKEAADRYYEAEMAEMEARADEDFRSRAYGTD